MIYITVLFSALMLTSCASGGVPDGSVAWCGNFEYTGTWVKAETDGRALGVSDSAVVDRMTVQDVIALAESMGCNRE
jgi:hypothetical protein